MRSGGSCWSWLWWDSSSFWSWSSLYCCMDKAPSTRPVAQVCGHTVVMFYRLTFSCLEMCYISDASFLSSVSLTLFHSQSTGNMYPPLTYYNVLHFLCFWKVATRITSRALFVEQSCLQQSCSYRAAATSEAIWQRKTRSALFLHQDESWQTAPESISAN